MNNFAQVKNLHMKTQICFKLEHRTHYVHQGSTSCCWHGRARREAHDSFSLYTAISLSDATTKTSLQDIVVVMPAVRKSKEKNVC